MLERLGAVTSTRTLVLDLNPAEPFARALRNLAGTVCVPSGRVRARDIALATRVIATKAAVERLQEVLGS
jgi:ribosomal protein L4